MESFWLIFSLQAIVFGGFCSFVANEKKRDSFSWFFLGFLFSLIALLALIAVPKREEIKNVGGKNIESSTTMSSSPMNEAGQSIVNMIKNILLGSERKE
jgi:hypothetical protein